MCPPTVFNWQCRWHMVFTLLRLQMRRVCAIFPFLKLNRYKTCHTPHLRTKIQIISFWCNVWGPEFHVTSYSFCSFAHLLSRNNFFTFFFFFFPFTPQEPLPYTLAPSFTSTEFLPALLVILPSIFHTIISALSCSATFRNKEPIALK